MNKEIAERWVAALRSGKYIQGKGCLRRSDNGVMQHCCLGVLTELYQEEMRHSDVKSVLPEKEVQSCLFVSTCSFSGECAVLPSEVMGWAGMRTKYGGYQQVTDFTGSGGLAGDNDHGMLFNQIADIVERHWEEM